MFLTNIGKIGLYIETGNYFHVLEQKSLVNLRKEIVKMFLKFVKISKFTVLLTILPTSTSFSDFLKLLLIL
jgi:hypothetical protein